MDQLTVYIVPALTDMASQCKIVARHGKWSDAAVSYKSNPDRWKEIGLMDAQGKLVCADLPKSQYNELAECQPLMAGETFIL